MAKGKSTSRKKRNRSIEARNSRREGEQEEKRDRYVKYGALAVILIVAGFYLSSSGGGGNASGSPAIRIDPTEHDFGDVSVAGGVVKTSMTITNAGDGNLVLSDMETSCGCTSATVEKDGKEGPAFGMKMHGNPRGWSETLAPGETALLNVYYDPTVHLDLRGPVTRGITVYSNDKNSPSKEILIFVNQVD